jgi:dienelactone hydrolase
MRVSFIAAAILSLSFTAAAMPWNVDDLKKTPSHEDAPEHDAGEIKAIFIDGIGPPDGKRTRIFAYYGIPRSEPGQKVPAMVLVHGGGGSAFSRWVKLWMDRGYAAISMDTCGAISGGGHNNHSRDEQGGPPGWGGFDQIERPKESQWTYNAVADVMRAHSWLRARPEVDAERTGITGISWGGYLTCVVAGVDDRFKFAAPVYGCGFLTDNSTWLPQLEKMGPANKERWRSLWDPSVYLPRAKMPMLWVTGTNDFAFPMDSLKKSYLQPPSERFLAIRPRMPHGHGPPGENPEEIRAMADAILKNGTPLSQVRLGKRDGSKVSATFTGKAVSAMLHYTTDSGEWQKRLWKETPASIEGGNLSAVLPENATVYYFNTTDDRGLVSSSEHEEP